MATVEGRMGAYGVRRAVSKQNAMERTIGVDHRVGREFGGDVV